MINFNDKPKTGVPELTSAEAQEIYGLIKQYGDADKAFKNQSNSQYYNKHFIIVNDEIERLYKEMIGKLSGGFLIKEAEPETRDNKGNIIEGTPAEYFVPSTESKFKSSLNSSLLDTDEIYNDFKGEDTWTKLKTKYIVEND